MNQEKIRSLLEEAAQSSCSHHRLNEIQIELGDAIAIDHPDSKPEDLHRDTRDTLDTLISSLFVSAITNNRRETLPTLFPVFAIICGNRDENSWLADVNWELVG